MGAAAGAGGRSYYATPGELRYRPWTGDFTPDDSGARAYPFDYIINPYQTDGAGQDAFLEWGTQDWDPALRFWELPYDRNLTKWLQVVDTSAPSIMAACEFGGRPERWQASGADLIAKGWLEAEDLHWRPDPAKKTISEQAWENEKKRAFTKVKAEIEQLKQLMEDDRDLYLAEIEAQADGLQAYFISFLGASLGRHPWTIELINCGLSIGNLVYNHYKQQFRRVRPSTLCPGLTPPFGPPAHPAFPSGHSFLGHLCSLLLLEIPGLRQRYGIFDGTAGTKGKKVEPFPPAAQPPAGGPQLPPPNPLSGAGEIKSPLLWLSQRLGKNRERMGVHYVSDTTASRHLAAAVWRAMLHEKDPAKRIHCPSLDMVIRHAIAEWPTMWPD